MTLEEAIKHAEEVAESQEYEGKKLEESGEKYHDEYENYCASQCFECAEEHRQLAEWLKDYKQLRGQEPKILDTLDFAIGASNGNTNYFVGFRNGLRYSKSLIDGKKPQFESCAEQEPKTGHWEQYGYSWEDNFKCSECGKEQPKILCGERIIGHWSDYCPNCGVKMVEPQESEG